MRGAARGCCAALIVIAPGGALADEAVGPEAPPPAIVVEARRARSPLDGVAPARSFDAETIAAQGAATIQDVIALLAGPDGNATAIIVNGRRIASVQQLLTLPPEALAGLQVYPPGQAGRFGFSGGGGLVNIVLKKRFTSRTATANVAVPGGLAGASGNLGAQQSALRGSDRTMGSLTLTGVRRLLASERPSLADPAATPHDRTLVAGRSGAAATLGIVRAAGGIEYGLDLNLSRSGSDSRTGSRARGDSAVTLQSTRNEAARVSATTSGMIRTLFWSIQANAGRDSSAIVTTGQGTLCAAGVASCRLQQIAATGTSLDAAFQLGGLLASLPGGSLALDLSAGRRWSQNINRQIGIASPLRATYGANTAALGLDIPILPLRPAAAGSFPGGIRLAPRLDLATADRSGAALGSTLALYWSPLPALQLSAMRSVNPTLPSADQTTAPQQIIAGTVVYDYRVNGLVVVDRLVGGAPLQRQSSRALSFDASYNGSIAGAQAGATLRYSESRERHPVVMLTEPSPVAELALPERFIRNAQGVLTRVDARPFNAAASVNRSLAVSLFASGAGQGADPARTTRWTFNLQGQVNLSSTLVLRKGAPAIDLLRRPLSLSGAPASPQQWSLRSTRGSARGGIEASLAWNSGVRAAAASGAEEAIRVAPQVKIGLAAFRTLTLGHGGAATSAAARGFVRLDLDNILDTRPDVRTTRGGVATRLDPWVLDPLGRTVRLTARVPF